VHLLLFYDTLCTYSIIVGLAQIPLGSIRLARHARLDLLDWLDWLDKVERVESSRVESSQVEF